MITMEGSAIERMFPVIVSAISRYRMASLLMTSSAVPVRNKSICTQEKATLWDENMRFVNPSNVYVDLSDNLYDLKQKVFNELSATKYHIV